MKLLIALICVLILIFIITRLLGKPKVEEKFESKIDLLIKDIKALQNEPN